MEVRRADFAGSWYPADSRECERQIREYLKESEWTPVSKNLKGGIVPHAGWYYSGSIACSVIHALCGGEVPDLVVVYGMHLHTDSPRYIMKEGTWATPFGNLEIHQDFAEKLIERHPFEIERPGRHSQDNTIELQLPFIKYFFQNTRLVPIGVPPREESLEVGRSVAQIAAELNLKLKVIGSTDLTHYGNNYGFVPHGTGSEAVDWVRNSNDRAIIEAMLEMAPETVIREALQNQNACCAGAASTAIATVKAMGADRAHTVAYMSSYDRRPAESFVGYVGMVFE